MENNQHTLVQNRAMVLMLNLSSLSFIMLPFLGVLVPLMIWISNRKKVSDIHETGRPILNFQLTWLIVLAAWFVVIIYGHDSLLKALNVTITNMGSKLRIQEIGILLLYFYNFAFVVLNTVLVSTQKKLIYFPSIPFFGKGN